MFSYYLCNPSVLRVGTSHGRNIIVCRFSGISTPLHSWKISDRRHVAFIICVRNAQCWQNLSKWTNQMVYQILVYGNYLLSISTQAFFRFSRRVSTLSFRSPLSRYAPAIQHNKVCIIDSGTRIWKDFIHGEVFFAFLFLHFPISHYLLCLLFALGNKQTTPEQITTIVYAKMWETERNMKNWKKREC